MQQFNVVFYYKNVYKNADLFLWEIFVSVQNSGNKTNEIKCQNKTEKLKKQKVWKKCEKSPSGSFPWGNTVTNISVGISTALQTGLWNQY